MKHTKRASRLGLALIALLATLAMTVTSTYAWFTLQGAATVDNFQLDVMTGGGILKISTNQSEDTAVWQTPGDFKTVVPGSELKTLLGLVASNFALGAFTTQADQKAGLVREAGGTAVIPNVGIAADGGGWVEFYLNFYSTSAVTVCLSDSSRIATGNTMPGSPALFAWKDFIASENAALGITTNGTTVVNSTIASGSAIYLSAAYAARLALIPITATGTTNTQGTPIIWNPQATGHITDNRLPLSSGGARDFYYIIQDFNNPITVTANFGAEFRKSVTGTAYANEGLTVDTASFKLDKGIKGAANQGTVITVLTEKTGTGEFYGRIQVRIWLEGFDTACVNAILGDIISTTLVFVEQSPAV